ncbi:calcium-binding protein [Aquabacterium lacunae]|nr:calcium-binding protein [Aquabacterium lacunae]
MASVTTTYNAYGEPVLQTWTLQPNDTQISDLNGSDTYIVNQLDGTVRLYDRYNDTSSDGEYNRIVYNGPDASRTLTPADLLINVQGGDIEITLKQTEEDAAPANGRLVLVDAVWDGVGPFYDWAVNSNVISSIQLGTSWYSFSDLAQKGAQPNTVNGTDQTDSLRGNHWRDLIQGGEGADELRGMAERDTLQGQAGDDTLWGGGDEDFLDGGIGNDLLAGGYGDDTLFGAAGTDTLIGNQGSNVYILSPSGQDVIDNRGGAPFSIRFTTDTEATLNKVDLSGLLYTSTHYANLYTAGSYTLNAQVSEAALDGDSLQFQRWGDTLRLTVNDTTGQAYSADILHYWGAEADAAGTFTLGRLGTYNRQSIEEQGLLDNGANTYGAPLTTGNTLLHLDAKQGDDVLSMGEVGGTVTLGEGRDTLVSNLFNGTGPDKGQTLVITDFGARTEPDQLVLRSPESLGVNDFLFARDGRRLVIRDADGYARSVNGAPGEADASSRIVLENFFGDDGQPKATDSTITLPDGTVLIWSDIPFATTDSTIQNGTAGADTLKGAMGNDTLRGGDGDDLIDGGYGVNNLYGGQGNDTLKGGSIMDWMLDITGNDTIVIRPHASAVLAPLATDIGNAEKWQAENIQVMLNGRSSQDIAGVSHGHLRYQLLASINPYRNPQQEQGPAHYKGRWLPAIESEFVDDPAGTHSLLVTFNDGSTIALLAAVNNNITDRKVFDQLVFDDTTLTVQDLLKLGTQADKITSGDLFGLPEGGLLDGQGKVGVVGNVGDDTIVGSAYGVNNSAGSDTFVIRPGEKISLTAFDVQDLAETTDRIVFEGTTAESQLRVKYVGPTNGTSDTNAVTHLQLTVQLPDGTTTHTADLPYAWIGQERAWASAFDEVQLGTGPVLQLRNIAEQIEGTDGADTLLTFDGRRRIQGLAGDDTLYGSASAETLEGGSGNNLLIAGDGNDVLISTGSHDTLNGGLGDDVFEISNLTGIAEITPLGKDLIRFTGTLRPEDLRLEWDKTATNAGLKAYTLRFAGQTTEVRIANTQDTRNLRIQFGDAPSVTLDELVSNTIAGLTSPASGLIQGSPANDSLLGLSGNDTLRGVSGKDLYVGGQGNDLIELGADADTVRYAFGDGMDTIRSVSAQDLIELDWKQASVPMYIGSSYSGQGGLVVSASSPYPNEQGMLFEGLAKSGTVRLQFSDGVQATSGLTTTLTGTQADNLLDTRTLKADVLQGMDGNDTLIAGPWGVTLDGGRGDDTLLFETSQTSAGVYDRTPIVYRQGDGHDTVILGGNGMTLKFGEGITRGSLALEQSSLNPTLYRLHIGGTEGSLTFQNMGQPKDYLINFSDGSAGTLGELSVTRSAFGEVGTTVTGTDAPETLQGTAGDDLIQSGMGNDVVSGGQGRDTIQYTMGGGSDTIYADHLDVLQLSAPWPAYLGVDVLPVLAGDQDLRIRIQDTDDVLTLANIGSWDGLSVKIGYNSLISGTELIHQGRLKAPVLREGTDLPELITGFNGHDTLIGGGGNDTLIGGFGDNLLDGGQGDDLIKNSGRFTLKFQKGDGKDTLDGAGAAVLFGPGLLRESLRVLTESTARGEVITIGFSDSNDQLTLPTTLFPLYPRDDYLLDDSTVLTFADGSEVTVNDLWLQASTGKALSMRGTDAADTLIGTDQPDTLLGLGGDDLLEGGAGNDLLRGGTGNDEVTGGEGADTIAVAKGDGFDLIHVDNQDMLYLPDVSGMSELSLQPFEMGDASLSFTMHGGTTGITLDRVGSWDDLQIHFDPRYANTTVITGKELLRATGAWQGTSLTGTDTADTLNGTPMDDTLSGMGGNDRLNGGDGDDVLTGGKGNDLVSGGAGHDTIYFRAKDGQDTLNADNQDTVILDNSLIVAVRPFRDGDTTLTIGFYNTTDTIQLTAPGNWDNLVVKSFTGPDWTGAKLLQEARNLVPLSLKGTDQDDLLEGRLGNDTINGGAGNDTLIGGPGSNKLTGGTGNDELFGGYSDDTFYFRANDGQDVIHGDQFDTLVLGAGLTYNSLTFQPFTERYGNLVFGFANSTDQITVVNVGDYSEMAIQFADGYRTRVGALVQAAQALAPLVLTGTSSDDTLVGRSGNDTLRGGLGNDEITGGLGNDEITGGEGADTVYFNAGDGQDLIHADSLDSLSFRAGITQASLQLQAFKAGDTALTFAVGTGTGSDRITLDNAGTWDGLTVQFADGTRTTGAALLQTARDLAPLNLQGTDAAEALTGKNGADTLIGGGGNDTLKGGLANDQLTGGLGNDEITGGEGADTVYFNTGNGQDLVHADSLDTLSFGEGITQDSLQLQAFKAGDTVLTFAVGSASIDRITLDNAGTWDGLAVQFADGTATTGAALLQAARDLAPLNLQGTDAAEALTGKNGADTLLGGGGNDSLSGGLANDQLTGGLGNDEITGGDGADTVFFNLGDGQDLIHADSLDTLSFGAGITQASLQLEAFKAGDTALTFAVGTATSTDRITLDNAGTWDGLAVQFADGTATTGAALLQAARDLAPLNLQGTDAAEALTGKNGADTLLGGGGNDTLKGGLANDQLTGGLGNDEITGGEGADTVFFNAGDGQDLVHADSLDTLVLGAGLNRSSLQLSQLPTTGGNELSLGFAGRTDRITLDQLGSWDGLTVQFADGTRTTGAALIEEARVQPLTLKGTSGKDTLTGQSKADTLSGLGGNDTLIGNQGNDTLMGGTGADTYRFKRGDGQDTLIENDFNTLSKDVLAFGDVAANQLWFTRSGQSLVVSVIGTQDRVTVQDWFKGSAYRVEAFTSSDGRSLSSSKVNSLVSAMAKFSAPAEGTTTLPTATAKALQPVLASSWV